MTGHDTIQSHSKHERTIRLGGAGPLASTMQYALEHAIADASCGRLWTSPQGCGCATCRVAKSCSACVRFVVEMMQEDK